MDLIQVVAFCLFTTLVCCESKPQFHHSSPHSISYSTPSPHSVSYSTPSPLSISYSTPSPHSVSYSTPSPLSISYSTPSPHSISYSTPSPHSVSYSTPSPLSISYSTPSPHSVSYSTPSPLSISYSTPSPHSISYSTSSPLSLSYSTPSSLSVQNYGSRLYTTPFSTSLRPPSQHSYNYNPVQVHTSSSGYRPTPAPIYTSSHSPIYSSSSAYVTPATSYLNRPGHLYGTPDVEGPAQYSFGYSVQDDLSGNQSGHQETRNGGVTQGSYHVRLPDGRLQRVTYSVQDGSGFVADVSYEGTAHYPVTQPQNLYQAPLIHRSTPYG